MARITYENKVALNENPAIADINKVKDDDMNEIKNSVNAIYEAGLIEVGEEEPTEEDAKIWVDTDEEGEPMAQEIQVSASEPVDGTKMWVGHSNNLFNPDNKISNANIDGAGLIVTHQDFNMYYIHVKSGETYTMSTGSSRQWVYTFFNGVPSLGKQGTSRIIKEGATETFTVPSGYNYICFRETKSGTEVITNLMANKGTTIRSYEPYVKPSIKVNINGNYEEIVSKNVYLEGEILIGEYKGKPLYRRIIKGIPNIAKESGGGTLALGVFNIEDIFMDTTHSRFKEQSSGWYPLPYVHGTTSVLTGGYLSISSSSNREAQFVLRKGTGLAFYEYEIVLEYTKTTD